VGERDTQWARDLSKSASLGYLNNKLERTIEINQKKAPIARRIFELYATGQYSLSRLRGLIRNEFGISLAKGYLDRLLKNPFYKGQFRWEGRLYTGTHTALISFELFDRVEAVFRGHNKPRYRSRDFAYRGLLTCAYDNCAITAETKKEKYTYYHCTGFRGKCGLPYFREKELGDRLGGILRDIHIPDAIHAQLQNSLQNDQDCTEQLAKQQHERNAQRLSQVQRRMDQAYTDKLDGKISEEFWVRKSKEWQEEANRIQTSNQAMGEVSPERFLNAARTLELANKAYFLYVKQDPAERAKLLKMVLSNCTIDAVSVYPTYRKPFDLIFQMGKTREWCARGDSNSRPLASEASALSS
jgi:site-specific DNA recombinase